jgi:hypothetical protein
VRPPAPDGTVTVEAFGNAITARAVDEGVPAAAVGVELDRHDPEVPVLAALCVERPA